MKNIPLQVALFATIALTIVSDLAVPGRDTHAIRKVPPEYAMNRFGDYWGVRNKGNNQWLMVNDSERKIVDALWTIHYRNRAKSAAAYKAWLLEEGFVE